MKRVNNILKIVGVIITAFCLTICIISVIGMFQCNNDQQFTMHFIRCLGALGLGIISILSTIEEI